MPLRILKRFRAARAERARTAKSEPALIESLEQRLALYADPFLASLPTLAMMRNINDTVVRFQTAQGFIDIEIYDRGGPPALVTAANFLNYVTSGRFDNTFFHRSIPNFVLQGGGFVDDPTTSPPANTPYSAVTADAAIVNEYSDDRKNVARTIAMAKLGGQPNSATNQFFFNLEDNPNLDTQNGGFTVFGKVIQGWDVVETIAAFQTRDLNQLLGGDAFGQVPLSGNSNTDLVRIVDAEIIKPVDQTLFYTQTIYFPEGFRSGRIISNVEMVNEDVNASALYQVIVRYEKLTPRDTVIASGTLTPGAHFDLAVSQAGNPNLKLVKPGIPFAYMIRSTTNVSATLVHKDFSATASESFFQAEAFDAEKLKNWEFAGAQKSPGVSAYIVYENLSASENIVGLVIYAADGTTVSLSKTIQPYRRGGIDLSQVAGLPNGLLAVRVVAQQPIVAALSLYRAAPARASIELGVPSAGNVEGVLPAANISSTGQAVITAMRTGAAVTTAITIDFEFILSDGSVYSNVGTLTLNTNVRFRRWDLSTLNGILPRDENFTIRYKVRNAAEPIAVTYYSIGAGTDAVATPFQTYSSKELVLAGGFTDPSAGAQGQETISIFNPFASSGVVANYRLRFHFVDGPDDEIILPAGGAGTVTGSRRVDIAVRNLTEVMARISSDPKFRKYSVSISVDLTGPSGPVEGAVFAQLTRIDPGGNTVAIGPTLHSGTRLFFADDASFGDP